MKRTRFVKRGALQMLTAAILGAVALAGNVAASTRVTAVPAGNVFAVRALGDTIVAGMDTSIVVSTDGGTTWHVSSKPSPDAKVIDALWIQNGRVYAGTFGTGVFVTDDLGATWQSFNQGLVGGILDSQLDVADLEVQGDQLFAATSGAGIYARNVAGTDTWHTFGDVFEPNQASNVNDIAAGGARLLACAGANGMVFDRDPGDAEWAISLLGSILRPGLTAQSSLWTGSEWVVGTNSGVFTSASGAEPWTPSATRLRSLGWSTFAQLGQTLFAAFDSANVILLDESHDGGATWTPRERVNDVFAFQLAVHGADLYIARSDGLWILPSATTSVGAMPTTQHLNFALSGPHPVRAVARFRFDLPRAGAAVLEVFDVAGRRAGDRIVNVLPAGPHEMTLNAWTLPPGVYAARLTAGPMHESLRFVRVP